MGLNSKTFVGTGIEGLAHKESTVVLKITCSDTKGLIYQVTKCLYDAGLNIIRNDEYVDTETNRFFMRTEFEKKGDITPIRQQLQTMLPDDANIHFSPDVERKIILMAGKEHHCLNDIVNRCDNGDLPAKIQCIISNHEVLLKIAERYDIPYHYVDHRGKSRKFHETEIHEIVSSYKMDYIVLAKYMRILSSDFVGHYRFRMINIHHSFLPAFKGARPYLQAFRRGVKVIGASAHFVSEDLDEGPIIEQDTIRVHHGYSPRDLAKAGKDVEKIVLARALDLICRERVFINGNKTVVF